MVIDFNDHPTSSVSELTCWTFTIQSGWCQFQSRLLKVTCYLHYQINKAPLGSGGPLCVSRRMTSQKGRLRAHGLSAPILLVVASLFSRENVFHSWANEYYLCPFILHLVWESPPRCTHQACTNLTSSPLHLTQEKKHTGSGALIQVQ